MLIPSKRILLAAKWILRNTLLSTDHLTPEISLRLITPQCPMWMSTPEQCPMPDPYWAFYWPGGQGITRYLIDNPECTNGKTVLDLGCGCGSATVAALMCGASHVVANDIDQYALLATRLNCQLNQVNWRTFGTFSSQNLLLQANVKINSALPQVILLGDVFYDSDFAHAVLQWLELVCAVCPDVRVLIGDPGRHFLNDWLSNGHKHNDHRLSLLNSYSLPGYVTREHYGFAQVGVYEWKINK